MFRSATRSVLKCIHLLGLTGDPVIVFPSHHISYPLSTYTRDGYEAYSRLTHGSVSHIYNVERPFWAEPQGRKCRLARGIR